jgi:hypothetical protein
VHSLFVSVRRPTSSLDATMKVSALLLCALVPAIAIVRAQSVPPAPNSAPAQLVEHDLSGSWAVQIEDLSHNIITTMTIRFGTDGAPSCIRGSWSEVVVANHTSLDEYFFPVSEQLSYELTGDRIVIGRNKVCDGYLHLDGELRGNAASGEYVRFGIGGSKQLGFFSLIKVS